MSLFEMEKSCTCFLVRAPMKHGETELPRLKTFVPNSPKNVSCLKELRNEKDKRCILLRSLYYEKEM